jgi:MFS transporter, UMF1 family
MIALMSPLLGAAADHLGARKKFLGVFTGIGVARSLLLYFVVEGSWKFAAAAFVLGYIGYSGGEIFYESLLPHIARTDEIDRVSTAGYALGYVGGGLLLAIHLAWITWPERFGMADSGQATRIALASVGVWWALFTVPILRSVDEPALDAAPARMSTAGLARAGFQRVVKTLREYRRHRQAFLFLLAFWVYNNGIITIIKMATIYGSEIGIGERSLIGALVLVQFLGIPSTFAYGALADRIGPKNGIYLALGVYTTLSLTGYFMSQAWHFWTLACVVAAVQGGCQAWSRSLFANFGSHPAVIGVLRLLCHQRQVRKYSGPISLWTD